MSFKSIIQDERKRAIITVGIVVWFFVFFISFVLIQPANERQARGSFECVEEEQMGRECKENPFIDFDVEGSSIYDASKFDVLWEWNEFEDLEGFECVDYYEYEVVKGGCLPQGNKEGKHIDEDWCYYKEKGVCLVGCVPVVVCVKEAFVREVKKKWGY